MAAPASTLKSKTLVITHDHCALHVTRKNAPERPKRLKWVMDAIKKLSEQQRKRQNGEAYVEVQEVSTSEAMLGALEQQLRSLSHTSAPARAHPCALGRTPSVGYLEEKILPAVKAVHTHEYIERLATTCVSLADADKPDALAEIDLDTVVSASSLSAALCAALSCCYAVDAVCDRLLSYRNAFAVVRPPGHHAGANGPTVGPHKFAEVSHAAALRAQPAVAAFAFAHQAVPCDGMDCSQGFCLLNNAAIAARHALLAHAESVKRVCIVDIDLHHGNGTEEIVNGWADVMYCSIHGVGDLSSGDTFYPDTATSLQEEELLVNVPLPQGTASDAYLAAFDKHLAPAVLRFAPDLILISAGFDACAGDSPAHPDGYLALDPAAFYHVTTR